MISSINASCTALKDDEYRSYVRDKRLQHKWARRNKLASTSTAGSTTGTTMNSTLDATTPGKQSLHSINDTPVSPGSDLNNMNRKLLSNAIEIEKDSDNVFAPVFNIITVNIAGLRFQTHQETVENYPTTLLGSAIKRGQYYNQATDEYFFDRHRASFEAILYYYQSGKIKRPDPIPIDVFLREINFFELGDEAIEQFWAREGYRKPVEEPLPKNKFQRQLFQLVEHPNTSSAARIVAFVSVGVIIISTISFCLETLESMKDNFSSDRFPKNETVTEMVNGTEISVVKLISYNQWKNPFFILEMSCIIWFSLEFILRFGSSPTKCIFVKSFLNIVDFVAIVPFYINLFVASDEGESAPSVLRVLRLVRVFRIFKLSRHSKGLQILGKTFNASIQELGLLVFFLIIGVVLFSSAVYFAENEVHETQFTSIPTGFWYAIVTMTTVGYGDMSPKGTMGKLVGTACAVCGVLVLAMPVPVIVSNFKHYYKQETRLAHMQGNGEEDFDEADSDSS